MLAIATFGSVRSANRAARVAERTLLLGLRPTLVPSRAEDPDEDVDFAGGERLLRVPSGSAVIVHEETAVLMAMALRNVGAGLAVLHSWHLRRGRPGHVEPADPDDFRRLTRDLYVAPGDTGWWQGAVRDASDPLHEEIVQALEGDDALTIDVLYTDQEGGQRFVTRFTLRRDGDRWRAAAGRHWALDEPSR
ncbi:MAG: hypothetical protein M3Z33_04745 [Actinomycetota bacterium]|nr:hypothetical protein [Actinomycetota bacterium]